MEQLPRLRARIASLEELRELMQAMRALAASHVQEAQAALNGIREYVGVVEDAIAEGTGLLPDADSRALTAGGQGDDVLVAVCSEHGFVGGFNDQLLDHAQAALLPGRRLAVIGGRGAMMAGERGLDPAWSLPMATHVGGILALARRVCQRLAGAVTATVVFGSYRRGGRYNIEQRTILPLDPVLLARGNHGARPLHHLPAEILLQQLAGEYLLAEVARSLMESFASENGARLHVMEAADRNLNDKRDRLARRAHSLRQETITAELLDLVTGVEAILDPAGTLA
jgi:F-type H+-transporting ATPase subunit gamma